MVSSLKFYILLLFHNIDTQGKMIKREANFHARKTKEHPILSEKVKQVDCSEERKNNSHNDNKNLYMCKKALNIYRLS